MKWDTGVWDTGLWDVTFEQTVAGTLTSSGALTRSVSRTLAGTLTSAGALTRSVSRTLAGMLTSSGALTKQWARTLAGTLTSAGALTRQTGKALAGTLTSSGAFSLTDLIELTLRAARSLALTLQAMGRALGLALRSRSISLTVPAEGIMSSREVTQGLQTQGAGESLIYSLTTTNWIASPTSPSLTVYDSKSRDVTADVTTGSASVSGDVITLPTIRRLSAGETYRAVVAWTVGSNTYSAYFEIQAER